MADPRKKRSRVDPLAASTLLRTVGEVVGTDSKTKDLLDTLPGVLLAEIVNGLEPHERRWLEVAWAHKGAQKAAMFREHTWLVDHTMRSRLPRGLPTATQAAYVRTIVFRDSWDALEAKGDDAKRVLSTLFPSLQHIVLQQYVKPINSSPSLPPGTICSTALKSIDVQDYSGAYTRWRIPDFTSWLRGLREKKQQDQLRLDSFQWRQAYQIDFDRDVRPLLEEWSQHWTHKPTQFALGPINRRLTAHDLRTLAGALSPELRSLHLHVTNEVDFDAFVDAFQGRRDTLVDLHFVPPAFTALPSKHTPKLLSTFTNLQSLGLHVGKEPPPEALAGLQHLRQFNGPVSCLPKTTTVWPHLHRLSIFSWSLHEEDAGNLAKFLGDRRKSFEKTGSWVDMHARMFPPEHFATLAPVADLPWRRVQIRTAGGIAQPDAVKALFTKWNQLEMLDIEDIVLPKEWATWLFPKADDGKAPASRGQLRYLMLDTRAHLTLREEDMDRIARAAPQLELLRLICRTIHTGESSNWTRACLQWATRFPRLRSLEIDGKMEDVTTSQRNADQLANEILGHNQPQDTPSVSLYFTGESHSSFSIERGDSRFCMRNIEHWPLWFSH
jgi:hypothetical protein